MKTARLILALVALPLLGQDVMGPAGPIDVKIQSFTQAKDWNGLADLFETLTPRERGQRLTGWLQALNRAQRWERLLELCDAIVPQEDAKQGPKLSLARLLRAQALSQLQRHPEALLAHAETGRLGWADGFPNACAEARHSRDWAALQASAEGILAKAPEDPKALAWRGEALAQQGQLTEAEPLLQKALTLDPSQPFAWSNLARCLNERKAWKEALEACDKALGLDPKVLEARFNRGRACFELARYQEARDDFQAALTLLPGDAVLLENLKQAQRYLDTVCKSKRAKK
ncbi:MAG: tetratricopeptide repeat protein [Acidobacteria bacterium]|nr:tetratricopeptide repeat protein [Acidobacteriota bacterium]